MAEFLTKHVNKILLANGVLDLMLLVIPPRQGMLKDVFVPVLTKVGGEAVLVDNLLQSWAIHFAFHGAVRILAGLNVETKVARQMAILSYLFESLPVAYLVLVQGNPHMSLKASLPLIVLPWLGILAVSMYKAEEKKKNN